MTVNLVRDSCEEVAGDRENLRQDGSNNNSSKKRKSGVLESCVSGD